MSHGDWLVKQAFLIELKEESVGMPYHTQGTMVEFRVGTRSWRPWVVCRVSRLEAVIWALCYCISKIACWGRYYLCSHYTILSQESGPGDRVLIGTLGPGKWQQENMLWETKENDCVCWVGQESWTVESTFSLGWNYLSLSQVLVYEKSMKNVEMKKWPI